MPLQLINCDFICELKMSLNFKKIKKPLLDAVGTKS